MAGAPRIIAVLNQKGGVAKTTTTANLGASLALRGYRTLLIDMDPQANLSLGFGARAEEGRVGLHDILQRKAGVRLEHITVPVEGLPLLVAPASFELAIAEAVLTPVLGSGYRLKQALESYLECVDFVLIDCPPSLGRLTEMAIVASTHLLVPTEPKLYSFAGMDTLNRMYRTLAEDLTLDVKLLGVLLTMVEKRPRLHKVIAEEIRGQFGEHVFQTAIRRTVRISESELDGRPAILADKSSTGAQDYRALTDEVLQRLQAEPRQTARPVDRPRLRPQFQFPLITTPPDVMREDLEELGLVATLEETISASPPSLGPSTVSVMQASVEPDVVPLFHDREPVKAVVTERQPARSRFGDYIQQMSRRLTGRK